VDKTLASISELPLESRLGHVIKRAEQTLINGKNLVLREVDLTVPQYAALLALSEGSGASGAQLARRCLVTPQTMHTTLANLEAKELIERERSEVHSQVLVARLTRKGRAVLKRADQKAVSLEQHVADAFTPEERQLFHDLLERAIKAINDFHE
jgi:DNA-binding MarR family transcriptional regulator